MTVLVTGGRGFIGRHVVDALLERGRAVVDYSRDVPTDNSPEGLTRVLGELGDLARLLGVIREHGVERVIHTAAQSHPDVSLQVPFATMEANVMGTCAVLEAARLTAIRRVVLFSSEAAYGDTLPGLVDESTPLDPRTPYGVSKAATEMLGRAYARSFGMDVISLRVSEVYGPGQLMPEFVGDAIRRALREGSVRLPRGGEQALQLVHVRDVTQAVLAACFVEEHESDVYNVTGGEQTTCRQVLEMLATIMPEASFAIGPGDLGWDGQGPFSIAAARRDLRYEPTVALADGLREYVDWLRRAEY